MSNTDSLNQHTAPECIVNMIRLEDKHGFKNWKVQIEHSHAFTLNKDGEVYLPDQGKKVQIPGNSADDIDFNFRCDEFTNPQIIKVWVEVGDNGIANLVVRDYEKIEERIPFIPGTEFALKFEVKKKTSRKRYVVLTGIEAHSPRTEGTSLFNMIVPNPFALPVLWT